MRKPKHSVTVPVRLSSPAGTAYITAYVASGMLFNISESGDLEAFICENTVRDTGLAVEQFRQMVRQQGLSAMLKYYPEAFLRLGANRHVHCQLLPYAMKGQVIEAR